MPEPSGSRRQSNRVTAAVLLLVIAGALGLLALGARLPAAGREGGARGGAVAPEREDPWTRYLGIGDTLGKAGGAARGERDRATGLTAGKAYLLAFYEAYDAGHLHRMAVAAQRLDHLGDREAARRIRRVLAEYPYPGEARD